MADLLEIQDLTIQIINGEPCRKLVDRVNLRIEPGRPFSLIGETGCGKTLIAQALLGLVPPEMSASGVISYRGKNLLACTPKEMRRLWGRELFLFPQEPGRYLNPLRRSNRQVNEVFRWVRKLGRGGSRTRGRELLNRVGLSAARDGRKYPWQLSGGMNQRLLTAITLAEPARMVLADEPTKGLDTEMKHLAVDLMREISAAGKSLFVITHDLEVAQKLGGELAVMYAGVIVEAGPAKDLINRPRHPYTRALLASLPQNGLIPIPLRINGAGQNGGCVFAPRCAQAAPPCFDIEPLEKDNHDDRRFCRCHFRC